MKRWVIGLSLCASMFLVGCKENEEATKKCKGETDLDDCKECCSDAGASGHKYINGKCACL